MCKYVRICKYLELFLWFSFPVWKITSLHQFNGIFLTKMHAAVCTYYLQRGRSIASEKKYKIMSNVIPRANPIEWRKNFHTYVHLMILRHTTVIALFSKFLSTVRRGTEKWNPAPSAIIILFFPIFMWIWGVKQTIYPNKIKSPTAQIFVWETDIILYTKAQHSESGKIVSKKWKCLYR